MAIDVRVEGAEQLAALAKRLKDAGEKDLRRELTRGIRDAARPIVVDAKAAALAIPASGVKTTGLRTRMARAIGVQVLMGARKAGVRVRVAKSKMGDQHKLPRAFDRGTVRHPVHGSDTYVTQDTHSAGWFSDVPKRHAPAVRRKLHSVMDDIARRVTR